VFQVVRLCSAEWNGGTGVQKESIHSLFQSVVMNKLSSFIISQI
jgi:hypothetical protein